MALRREALRALYRRGQGWREVSARDFGAAFAGDEWRGPAGGAALPHRRRPAAGLPRAALPRGLPRGDGRHRGSPRDRVRGARRRAGPPAHGAQGGPDRLGPGAGAVRPRRRLDRHAALHAARGRPGREPRGGPQRPAADPGLLPPDGRAPRAGPLDRPRAHRDLHPLRASCATTATPSPPSRCPKAALCLMGLDGAAPGTRTLPEVLDGLGVGPRDHAALRRAEGLGARHVLGPRRGHPRRALAASRPAARARRAHPAGAAGGADAHDRRRLAGPDRRARVRASSASRAAPGCGRTRSSTSSTRSSSRTPRASRASRSSTPASPGSRRTSSRRWWTR